MCADLVRQYDVCRFHRYFNPFLFLMLCLDCNIVPLVYPTTACYQLWLKRATCEVKLCRMKYWEYILNPLINLCTNHTVKTHTKMTSKGFPQIKLTFVTMTTTKFFSSILYSLSCTSSFSILPVGRGKMKDIHIVLMVSYNSAVVKQPSYHLQKFNIFLSLR